MAVQDKFAEEMLTDNELDQVAGGNYNETSEDSAFLNIYGLCGKYSREALAFDPGTSQEEDVKAGWAKVGVDYHYHGGYFGKINEYYISGNKVTREEAYRHLINLKGDPMSAYLKNHT